MRADCGSYSITMYMEPEPTREKKMKEIIDNETCYANHEMK